MSRRIGRIALASTASVELAALEATEPDVGLCSWSTARPVVDLPQPDSPTRPSVSPASMSKRHAGDGLHLRRRRVRMRPPPRTGKCLYEVVDLEQRRAGDGGSRRLDGPSRSSWHVIARSRRCAEQRPVGVARRRRARPSGWQAARWSRLVGRRAARARSCRQLVAGQRAARRERAAGRQVDQRRRRARDRRQPAAVVDRRGSSRAARRCTASAACRRRRRRRRSTSAPGVHHQHPVGHPGDRRRGRG